MNTWLPAHYRVVGDGPALPGNIELHTTYIDDFYLNSVKWKQYLLTLYSVLLLCFGEDIGPITTKQVLLSTFITLLGSILIGVFFGNIAVLMQ